MRTLIISDLHLGSLSGSDLLRRPDIRDELAAELEVTDRLVLLGDILELRHGPVGEAMEGAREFFIDVGRRMAGREVVLVAGNHDHGLIEPWLASRHEQGDPGALAPEQLIDPSDASRVYARIATLMGEANVRVAYPGVWVRPDVYATHGHYLDAHLTVPTLERLSMGVMNRVLGRRPADFSCPDDYEAMASPVFAWRDAVARGTRTGDALNGMATVNAWSALRGGGGGGRLSPARVRRRAMVAAFPLAVAALNRAGLGPLKATVSMEELRAAGLRAMGDAAGRIGLGDAHVVFGHTHRAGPLPADDAREWTGPSGARLVNTGSWTYAAIFLAGRQGESPYWPGSAVAVDDDGPPRVLRLLQDRTREELRPRAGAAQSGT